MQKPRRSRFSASHKWTITGRKYPGSTESVPESTAEIAPETAYDPFDEADYRESEPLNGTAGSEPPTEVPPSWFRSSNLRRFRGGSRRRRALRAFGFLVVGLLIGYGLARLGGRPSGSDAESRERENAVRLTAAEQDELDAAYLARYVHHFSEAEQRFAALRHKHPEWPGLAVDMGRTLLYAGNTDGARTALNLATGSRLTSADAHFALGVVDLAQQNSREAEASFAAAVAHDPTRPDYYYLWGESLRDSGKPMEAAEKYRAALTRNSYETADGLYRLKLWLSEIDSGQAAANGTDADIDAALAQPLPPMEALFAAAGRSLRAGDPGAAVELIVRAHERTDQTVFRVIMNDPTLAQVRWRPELAVFLRPAPSQPEPVTGSEGGLTLQTQASFPSPPSKTVAGSEGGLTLQTQASFPSPPSK